MNNRILRIISALGLSLSLLSCSHDSGSIAKIGNAGSTSGPYSIRNMTITDTGGGMAGFGYGAVWGYPGASADIGGIGIPAHIEGYWSREEIKKNGKRGAIVEEYHISAPIDSELAAKKVHTMRNYYQNYQRDKGIIQVVVEHERVQVFFTLACHEPYDNCKPIENVDSNQWVTKPDGTDVVILFDGKGESSPTPFPGSPYAKP